MISPSSEAWHWQHKDKALLVGDHHRSSMIAAYQAERKKIGAINAADKLVKLEKVKCTC